MENNEMQVVNQESEMNSDLGRMVQDGAVIQKIENETMSAISRQYPRNIKKTLDKILGQLELCSTIPMSDGKNMAEKVYYSIPYKNPKVPGGFTYVEGLGIHFANLISSLWGNCADGARIIADDKDGVTCEGVFIDLETNVRKARTVRVPREDWNKDAKKFIKLSPERFRLKVQAGLSKAVRNAILAAIPMYIKDACFQKAKQIVVQKKPLESVIKAFERFNIDAKTVADYMRKNLANLSQPERISHLNGIYNAIVDEETTVEDIFNVEAKEPKRKSETKIPKQAKKTEKNQGENCKKGVIIEDLKNGFNSSYEIRTTCGQKFFFKNEKLIPEVQEFIKTKERCYPSFNENGELEGFNVIPF